MKKALRTHTHTHTQRPYFFSVRTMSFSCGSAGKESARNAGDLSSIPGLGRSPGEGKGYPLLYSGLENSTDCIVNEGFAILSFRK